jgi:F-type H+-transporting ATPase subunit delta
VKTAVELQRNEQKALQERLEQYTSRRVRLRVSIEKELKGGLVIQIGDTVLDGSVTHQLELLRSRLLSGALHT